MGFPEERSIRRIADANLNRAAEGLRALEDAARFALENSVLSDQLRSLRHGLKRLSGNSVELLETRDILSDPGLPRMRNPEKRQNLEEFMLANAKRCEQAMRVLEELSGKDAGREQLYRIEKELLAILRRDSLRGRIQGVYGILDVEFYVENPLQALEAWLSSGLRLVQLRDKRASGLKRSNLAHAAASLCREKEALFLINDDIALALACAADGVHLGESDIPVRDARHVLGPFKMIGRTVRSAQEALQAESHGADYVSVGRLFPSRSKPQAPAVSLEALREIRSCVRVPVVGIGGIGVDNQDLVFAHGADAAACIESVTELLKRAGEKASMPVGS